MFVLERRLKHAEDERADIDRSLLELEKKYSTLQSKHASTSVTLRQQLESEKESRDNWKERYEQENTSLLFTG